MERVKKIVQWYMQSSMLVGAPILMFLVFLGLQKFLFTFTCNAAGFRCEYAIGASDGMAQYMGELLAANPGTDIIARPRK
jgi:hypothetical protein